LEKEQRDAKRSDAARRLGRGYVDHAAGQGWARLGLDGTDKERRARSLAGRDFDFGETRLQGSRIGFLIEKVSRCAPKKRHC